MDYSSDNHSSVYLLRLEHIYEKHESQLLSTPATVKLKVNEVNIAQLLSIFSFIPVTQGRGGIVGHCP